MLDLYSLQKEWQHLAKQRSLYLTITMVCYTYFVISVLLNILASDVAVGLEQTVYSVAESDGSVEVCIFATAPPNDVLLYYTITASTESASASKRQ